MKSGADHADLSDRRRASPANIRLTRNVIEIDPFPVACGKNSLGAQDDSVFFFVAESGKNFFHFLSAVLAHRLLSPAGEDLISMVMVVMMLVVVLMVVIVAMTFLTVVMMVLVLIPIVVIVIMVVMMLVFIVVVIFIIVVVMMFMAMLVIFIVVMIVMVMMSATHRAGVLFFLLHQLVQMVLQGRNLLQCIFQRLDVQMICRRRYDRSRRVLLPDQLQRLCKLFVGGLVGVTEQNTTGVCNLVVEELTEILHIHLALVDVHHDDRAVQRYVFQACRKHGAGHVAQLADAGRFDQNPVGSVFRHDLTECLAEISHKRATNTAGIHFGDLNARILQESAVHANLSELVFNQHNFFTLIRLFDQTVDQRGLAGSEKSGNYINFCHKISPHICF